VDRTPNGDNLTQDDERVSQEELRQPAPPDHRAGAGRPARLSGEVGRRQGGSARAVSD